MFLRSKKTDGQIPVEEPSSPTKDPIEPEGIRVTRIGWIKGILFLLVLVYFSLSVFSVPLLAFLGRYLVVAHEPQRSDLIVCLAGKNVERGIAAAEAYQKGLAPKILACREESPDGSNHLRERGIHYPSKIDLLKNLFKDYGIPASALLVPDKPVDSTFEEAELVREVVRELGCRSLILITSPTHSRRAWLTFRKVLEGESVRILVVPTPYSRYDSATWWNNKRYLKEVFFEYEKLIYYAAHLLRSNSKP